jgi:hypothetical protein
VSKHLSKPTTRTTRWGDSEALPWRKKMVGGAPGRDHRDQSSVSRGGLRNFNLTQRRPASGTVGRGRRSFPRQPRRRGPAASGRAAVRPHGPGYRDCGTDRLSAAASAGPPQSAAAGAPAPRLGPAWLRLSRSVCPPCQTVGPTPCSDPRTQV